MAIAFGKNSKVRWTLPAIFELPFRASEMPQTRLIDLRSAGRFGDGFIPGSFSVPNQLCLAAARACGLFDGRHVYLLADQLEQLQLCPDSRGLSKTACLSGWFGPDALDEWQKCGANLGSFDAISPETLAIRLAAWKTVIIDIREPDAGDAVLAGLYIPDALRIPLNQLRTSLAGLPAASSICLVCETGELASFPASILWNTGFHNVAYLAGGFRGYVRNGWPVKNLRASSAPPAV